MRIFHRVGLILLIGMFMIIISYGSYRFYMLAYGNEDKQKNEQYLEKKKLVQVDKPNTTLITQNTVLKVENYNRKEGTILEMEETMPVEYIGMDRQQLTSYLEEYEKEPSIADLEMGFEKYQIISFSSDQVVLRKTFTPPNVAYKYYLTEEDGCVIVYYIDKKTVFEYTNILVNSLPEELQRQLRKGKYITDIDSLYDFLENYSS